MKILVVSEHDDCCGPMAAAFLGDYSDKLQVVSAGRDPHRLCPPLVVAAMRECLIDLVDYRPRALAELDPKDFDVVYECPDFPCPEDLDSCRVLRDRVKNETFLFFRKLAF
ncbi:MAG: hypothetical protein K6A28_07175 [Bacteroidales bacterium]|nr:hypothetical protein [Bacteroidales bacterium]